MPEEGGQRPVALIRHGRLNEVAATGRNHLMRPGTVLDRCDNLVSAIGIGSPTRVADQQDGLPPRFSVLASPLARYIGPARWSDGWASHGGL